MISYIISYIVNHLSNASILDAPVTIQELCTRLLNTSTYICCNPDRIQLICPVQLLSWTVTGGAHHGGAERSRRNLQPVHADDVPECHSRTYQLVCPAVIFCIFAQLVDLSNDRIHGPVIQAETTLCLPVLVCVGASRRLEDGQNSKHTPSVRAGHDALVVVQGGHWSNKGLYPALYPYFMISCMISYMIS